MSGFYATPPPSEVPPVGVEPGSAEIAPPSLDAGSEGSKEQPYQSSEPAQNPEQPQPEHEKRYAIDLTVNNIGKSADGSSVNMHVDGESGMQTYALPDGGYRYENRMCVTVNGVQVVREGVLVIDRNGNIVDIEDDQLHPMPFAFARPFSEMGVIPEEEQRAAGVVLDGIRRAIFEKHPETVTRNAMGHTHSIWMQDDVVVQAVHIVDPRHPMLNAVSIPPDSDLSVRTDYIKIIERQSNDFGHAVTYHLDRKGIPRRWDALRQTPNQELRGLFETQMRLHTAKQLGPGTVRAFQRELAAKEAAANDRRLAAYMGHNYLPVGLTEIRNMGRFVGEQLGIVHDLRDVLSEE